MNEHEEDFAAMFEASTKARQVKRGETVDGTIVAIGPKVASHGRACLRAAPTRYRCTSISGVSRIKMTGSNNSKINSGTDPE